jgi:predicted HicB family RNase H-like nuclease
MKYKGYEAAVNFEEGDDCFVGKVINIEGPTAVVFDAQSVSELKVEFREMINFYLETCKKKGINPKQPMSGKMTLRMTPEIHAGVLSMAYTQGLSANKFINQTLEQKLRG